LVASLPDQPDSLQMFRFRYNTGQASSTTRADHKSCMHLLFCQTLLCRTLQQYKPFGTQTGPWVFQKGGALQVQAIRASVARDTWWTHADPSIVSDCKQDSQELDGMLCMAYLDEDSS
jgi:hypothetical protein